VTIQSFNPRSGEVNGTVAETPTDQVAAAVGAAVDAAATVGATSPIDRRDWLYAVADALEATAGDLVELADKETALGATRLSGEVQRSAGQLRFYGDVAADGAYLESRSTRSLTAGLRLPGQINHSDRWRFSGRATSRSPSASSATTPAPRSQPAARFW